MQATAVKGTPEEWCELFNLAETTEEIIAYWDKFTKFGWTKEEHKHATKVYKDRLIRFSAADFRARKTIPDKGMEEIFGKKVFANTHNKLLYNWHLKEAIKEGKPLFGRLRDF
jgi:hypothetical protein